MKFIFENENMGETSFGILCHTATRTLKNRGSEMAVTAEGEVYTITLRVDDSFANDRFTVTPSEGSVELIGGNDLSLHAAFGRFILDSFFDGRGGFQPPKAPVDFTPKCPLRGMYFATHFHNFYHNAPIEKVYEVIENLALRGCNNLLVWFDMHHFASMEDQGAQELVVRLRAILSYANKIGITGSLTMLSNEAFSSSPEALRAEWKPIGRYHSYPDDHYHLELCPSKEGGIEEILRERREMLSYFCDLDIAYICYWPYDQGGCTCLDCQPWGSNGFLKLLPHFQRLVGEMMPKTRIILSTWYFDKFVNGEWDEFYPKLTDGTIKDVHYIMSFFFNGEMPECVREGGVPEGYKFIDFPEISMYTCYPWGGFGASVLTSFLDRTNKKTAGLYSGGFPYSEGIFEDINKFIELCRYTGLYEDAADAVRAYVRSEFCVEGKELDELSEAIMRTETGLARDKVYGGESNYYGIKDTSDVESVYRTLTKFNSKLPECVRTNIYFRMFYLRAVIDRELVSCEGYPLRSELCQAAMRELNGIYHATSETKRCVKSPEGV